MNINHTQNIVQIVTSFEDISRGGKDKVAAIIAIRRYADSINMYIGLADAKDFVESIYEKRPAKLVMTIKQPTK